MIEQTERQIQLVNRQRIFNQITTIIAAASFCYLIYNWWTKKSDKDKDKTEEKKNKKNTQVKSA